MIDADEENRSKATTASVKASGLFGSNKALVDVSLRSSLNASKRGSFTNKGDNSLEKRPLFSR